jgi:hypothetical protein
MTSELAIPFSFRMAPTSSSLGWVVVAAESPEGEGERLQWFFESFIR